MWWLAEQRAPDHDITAARPLVIDVDGVLVLRSSGDVQAELRADLLGNGDEAGGR